MKWGVRNNNLTKVMSKGGNCGCHEWPLECVSWEPGKRNPNRRQPERGSPDGKQGNPEGNQFTLAGNVRPKAFVLGQHWHVGQCGGM
jgi:hypothetical protein